MQMHGCAAVWEQAAAAEQQQQEIARSAATVRVLGRALREELAAEEAGGEEPAPPWYTRWWAAVALATASIAAFITWAIDTVDRLLTLAERYQRLRGAGGRVLRVHVHPRWDLARWPTRARSLRKAIWRIC